MAAAAAASATQAPFCLHVARETFTLVSCRPPGSDAEIPSLVIHREKRARLETSLATTAIFAAAACTEKIDVYGLLGFLPLLSGDYLVVVTARTPVSVAMLKNSPLEAEVYTVSAFRVLPVARDDFGISTMPAADRDTEMAWLRNFEQVCRAGYIYFSNAYDLTSTVEQNLARPRQTPLWQCINSRFHWNAYLSSPLLALAKSGDNVAGSFILPAICGFVKTTPASISYKMFHYTLISRKCVHRVGVRYHSRGIDDKGNVSNFVETEQIVSYECPSKMETKLFSFLQIRGSIPLFWRQIINAKYTPLLEITTKKNTEGAFALHANSLFENYNGNVVMVNLVNCKGYELPLSNHFESLVQKFNNKNLRYIHFDFHKECSKMRYGRLSLLLDRIASDLETQGYFSAVLEGRQGGTSAPFSVTVLSRQKGIIRTNCIDCLDRTNVVQGHIARSVLEKQLCALGILGIAAPVSDLVGNVVVASASTATEISTAASGTRSLALKEMTLLSNVAAAAVFEEALRNIWADNADACSMLYSGTGALKTEYTRTGRRTHVGVLQDARNSDLMLGVFGAPKAACGDAESDRLGARARVGAGAGADAGVGAGAFDAMRPAHWYIFGVLAGLLAILLVGIGRYSVLSMTFLRIAVGACSSAGVAIYFIIDQFGDELVEQPALAKSLAVAAGRGGERQ